MRRTVKRYGSYASLICGALIAYWGWFMGTATSATGTYRWLLREWALCTGAAIALFLVGFALGPKWARWGAASLLMVTLVAGLDPAQRLAAIGWSGQ